MNSETAPVSWRGAAASDALSVPFAALWALRVRGRHVTALWNRYEGNENRSELIEAAHPCFRTTSARQYYLENQSIHSGLAGTTAPPWKVSRDLVGSGEIWEDHPLTLFRSYPFFGAHPTGREAAS